jgi:hypothetical protein
MGGKGTNGAMAGILRADADLGVHAEAGHVRNPGAGEGATPCVAATPKPN